MEAGDTWGQYIIIDIDEEIKIQKNKCDKPNKFRRKKEERIRNNSWMGCIEEDVDEEEYANMEMGISSDDVDIEEYDEDDINYVINDKSETIMDTMSNICNITWIICTTLIKNPYEMKMVR